MVLLDVRVLGSIQALRFRILVVGFGIFGFWFFRPLGAADKRGKEPHKSAKLADFAMPAPFPEAISQAPWIFWISG